MSKSGGAEHRGLEPSVLGGGAQAADDVAH